MSVITATVCQCDKCGHKWLPSDEKALPARCGRCKSPAWNKSNGTLPALIVKDAPEVQTPKVQEAPTVQDNVRAFSRPDFRAAKPVKQKFPKEVKAPVGKKKMCPHGFLIVDGVTQCERCK